jgi:two-component system LytT family response regulator
VYFYPVNEIIRCEASSNYTQFFLTEKRTFLTSKTLKEYDEILSPHGFLRVHKSHLVNLAFAEDYLGKDFIRLKDKTEVEVARRRKEAVLFALANKRNSF